MEDAKMSAKTAPIEAVVLPAFGADVSQNQRRMSQMSSEDLAARVRENRTGTLTVSEAEAVVRNLSKKESSTELAHQRTKTYKYVSIVTAISAVVMVVVMLSINLAANEISKDTKPNKQTGALMTYDGSSAIATADVEITHGLFDLPKLTIDALKQVKTITLILENKEEWLVQVQSVAKTPCSTSVVFYGNNAAVHVDTRQSAAYAVIRDGEKHLITGSKVNRALAESRGLAYTEKGFASIATAKMDAYEDQAACEGVTLADTGLFGTGTISGNGYTADLFFAQDAGGARETFIANSDGTKNLFANNMTFFWSAEGLLSECRYGTANNENARSSDAVDVEPTMYTFDAPQQWTPSNVKPYTVPTLADCRDQGAFIQSEASAAAAAAANPGGRRLLTTRENEEELEAIRTGGAEGARAYTRIALAHLDEELASVEDGSDHHRSLLERRSLASKAGTMMMEAYNQCSYGNGQACGYSDGCMFAFRGSDDFNDWWANIGQAFSQSWQYGGVPMHQGFVNEYNKIKGSNGYAAAVAACGGSAIFVGHSLGGAIAVVAREAHGQGQVMTFGAPSVYYNRETCNIQGYRMMHEGDPVPLLAKIAGYDHGRTPVVREIDNYCREHYQVCLPSPCSCSWRGCRTCWSCHNTICKHHGNRLIGRSCYDNPSSCGLKNAWCLVTISSHGSQGYKDMT